MADFSDLIVPVPEEEVLAQELNVLELSDFPVTAYQPGTVARTLLQAFANVMADAWLSVSQIAAGATLTTASAEWLDLLAAGQYAESRKAGVYTVGTIRLTDAGGGPHSVSAGQLYVATSSGLRYRNISAFTIPLNGYVDAQFYADSIGAEYNVANGAIGELMTTLATVTVANPSVGTSGTWITTLGADVESDSSLRERCLAKWATLATGSPPNAYISWALAQTGVTRAAIDDANPLGPGTAKLYVDSSGAVAATQAYVDARKPIGTAITVQAATTITTAVAGIVTVRAEYAAQAQAEVGANLLGLALATPIGGTIYAAEIIEQVMRPIGVVNFVPTSLSDIVLGAGQIPSITTAALSFASI